MTAWLGLLAITLIAGFVAQSRVKRTVARNLQIPVANGLTGAEVARRVLDANGLHDVPVEEAPGGSLSDHYDPRSRSVHLSSDVYNGRSIAATAVGAHEVGHAIQHQQTYAFFRFRSALFPAVTFADRIWTLLFFGGLIFGVFQLVAVGVALYAVAVLFQLVTLPVEFDASRRAKRQLRDLGLVASNESDGVASVLTAAAWTYVVGALVAVLWLLYYLQLFSNR